MTNAIILYYTPEMNKYYYIVYTISFVLLSFIVKKIVYLIVI